MMADTVSDAAPRIPRQTTGGRDFDAIMLEARRAAHDVVTTARHLSSDHVREVRTEGRRSVGGARSKAEAMIDNAYGYAEAVRLAAVGDRASARESLRAAERHLERSQRKADALRRAAEEEVTATRERLAGPALQAIGDVTVAVTGVARSAHEIVDDTATQCDEALRRLADLRRRLAPRPADGDGFGAP